MKGPRSRVPCMGSESRAPLFRFAKNNMPIPNYKMFVQSCICQISIKKNSTKFLTLSKFFANFGFTIVKSHFFANITLSMEVVINITSQSSIIIACFNTFRTFFQNKLKVYLQCRSHKNLHGYFILGAPTSEGSVLAL